MNIQNRTELIALLTEELVGSTKRYSEALDKHTYVYAGCEVDTFDCKEAIKRRIKVLREELLELSKSL